MGPYIIGDHGVKVDQQLIDGIHRIVGGIELIGGRHEVAFQPVVIPQRDILEEGEGVVVVGGGFLKLLHRGHPLLFQQGEDLVQGIALWDDHIHHRPGGGVGTHASQQSPVIHIRVQGIGTHRHIVLAPCEGGKELEEPLILDQPLILQPVHDAVEAVLRGDGNGHFLLILIQGQHIVCGDPKQAGQQDGHSDDSYHIEHGEAGGPAGRAAAGTAGGGALLPPASSFTSSFLGHSGQLLIKFFRVLVTRDKGPP